MFAPPIRTAIWGSCVSRDIIRVVPEQFELGAYIARQSWVSAFSPSVSAPDLSRLTSNFQRRNVRGDFQSSARVRIESVVDEVDLFVVDLASDRHGVADYRGGMVSLTPDHRRAFGGIVDGGRRVLFGSDEHLALFRVAALDAAAFLDRIELMSRTVVLNVPFTDVTTTGVPMGAKEPAEAINARYEDYYNLLEVAGFNLLRVPEGEVLADPDHIWGLDQIHYSDSTYYYIAKRLSGLVGRAE